MILHDVNVLVYAFRRDSPQFATARTALERSLAGGDSVMFCPTVAASFLRIVTNPRILVHPSPLQQAWSFLEVFQDHRASVFTDVDAMTYGIFRHITLTGGETANAVPDALLAALAIRHDAVLVSADAGYKRYQGLRLELL